VETKLMTRRSFSKKDRARIFAANCGCCHLCEGKIAVGEKWDVEHVIPWALTRDDSDANLRPAHVKCHAVKTAKDVGDIARAERRRAKHLGYAPKTRNPIKSRGFGISRLWTPTSKEDAHDTSD
jgi:5-methylcytosine-specific restriction enzyme A